MGTPKGFNMRITALFGLSALALAAIFVVAPKATVTANPAFGMSGIDTLAITMAAKPMPEQQFPAH